MANYTGNIKLTAKGLKAFKKSTKGYVAFREEIFDLFYNRNDGTNIKASDFVGNDFEALVALLYNRHTNGSFYSISYAPNGHRYNGGKKLVSRQPLSRGHDNDWLHYIKNIKKSTIKKWAVGIAMVELELANEGKIS